eukprot:1161263-Pelagomonas_calceolata.AAC.33
MSSVTVGLNRWARAVAPKGKGGKCGSLRAQMQGVMHVTGIWSGSCGKCGHRGMKRGMCGADMHAGTDLQRGSSGGLQAFRDVCGRKHEGASTWHKHAHGGLSWQCGDRGTRSSGIVVEAMES